VALALVFARAIGRNFPEVILRHHRQ